MKKSLNTIPLDHYTIGIIIFCAVWFAACVIVRVISEERSKRIMKVWRITNSVLAACCFIMILYITLINRSRLAERLFLPRPFYNIVRAIREPVFRREKLLNLYMFIPFGAVVSCAFCSIKKERRGKGRLSPGAFSPLYVIICSCIFSLLIEVTQAVFFIGTAETDDIITNTAGAAIGVAVWFAAEYASARLLRYREYKRGLL